MTLRPSAQVALAIAGAAAVKVALSLLLEPTSIEVYLWMCAKRPALGYFDYPGMAPWLIALSTAAFGDSCLGMRLLTIACGAGTAALTFLAARRLYGEASARLAGFLAALVPLVFHFGSIASPDAPLMLFWTASFAAAAAALTGGPRWLWIAAGAAAGLAMQSKYQAVFAPAGLFAFLLLSPDHRPLLRRPDPWLAVLAAVAVFSPTLAWNATNAWSSLEYQGVRRFTERGFDAKELVDFPVSQIGWLTPFVLAATWADGVRALVRWRTSPWRDRLCAAVGLPVVLFFTAVLFVRTVRGHWPGPGYLSLLILAAERAVHGSRLRRRLLEWTCGVLAVGYLLAPLAVAFVPRAQRSGWARLAAKVGEMRPDFVVGREYHLASQLAYHLRPIAATDFSAAGKGAKSFPLWWRPGDFAGKDAVVVFEPKRYESERAMVAEAFASLEPAVEVRVPRFGGKDDVFLLVRARGYRP